MNRSQKGFTLIELMIVIAIIAIIAAIAIPNLLAARLASNETAAIATLRQIIASQSQFQQGARVDEDGDGAGEYGGFVEMSGGIVTRTGPIQALTVPRLNPSVLNASFQVLNATGEATRSGYLFKIFLPDLNFAPVAEPQAGFGTSVPDADARETTWACYATPGNYNQTGNRIFFTHQGGDILQAEVEGTILPGALTGVEAWAAGITMAGRPDIQVPAAPGQLAALGFPVVSGWTVVSQ